MHLFLFTWYEESFPKLQYIVNKSGCSIPICEKRFEFLKRVTEDKNH